MKRVLLATVGICIVALVAYATAAAQPPVDGKKGKRKKGPESREGRPRGEGGSERGPGRRPPPPIFKALDADRDGVISAEEIENATAALKTLDKNGDGKLTREELRPEGPPRRGPEGREGPPRRGPEGRRPGGGPGKGRPDGERPKRPDAT